MVSNPVALGFQRIEEAMGGMEADGNQRQILNIYVCISHTHTHTHLMFLYSPIRLKFF